MDKETYKVAVNLLARYADKTNKPSFALSPATPGKPLLNRSLPTSYANQRTTQLALPMTPQLRVTSSNLASPRLQVNSQISTTASPSNALMLHSSGANQQLRRRTPFPIVNQQEKGVFDRIVDVLVGDGPQDRFAMICKECYAHNGMALKDDFEYTTYRCAFCNALNPARKTRPVAPRLSAMHVPSAVTADSDTSDSDDDKDESAEETSMHSDIDAKSAEMNNSEVNNTQSTNFSSSAETAEESAETSNSMSFQSEEVDEESRDPMPVKEDSSIDQLVKQLEKSAIKDTTMSPE